MPSGMTPEPEIQLNPESHVQKWGKEVKSQFRAGKALGSVSAHTNFNVIHDDSGDRVVAEQGITDYNKGSGIFLQGDITRKQGETLFNLVDAVNSPYNGFPSSTQENTLYFTVLKPKEGTSPKGTAKYVDGLPTSVGDDIAIVEVRYIQPNADETHNRSAEKRVHLVVPTKAADELQRMVSEGLDPNELHDAVVDIFTTPETRKYFDATKVDPTDNSTILINPGTPKFEKTLLSTLEPTGKMTRRTIEPVEEAIFTELTREPTIEKTPIDPEDTPVHRMPPIEPPTPPAPPTEATPEPEKPEFEPSWMLPTEDDLNSIKSDSLKRRISRLHEAAKNPGLLSRDLWTQEYLKLMHDADEDKFPDDHDNIDKLLINMTVGIKAMDDKEKKTSSPSSDSDVLKEIRDAMRTGEKVQEEQLDYQRQQIELMRKGYKGFAQGIVKRLHVNPEQYDQSLPPWFEELDSDTQQMFTNLLHINYLAAIKRDSGMVSLDNWVNAAGLRLEDEALDEMNREMPGFRIALATFTHDIFEEGQDHLVISGNPKSGSIDVTGGYAIVGSERTLKQYREDKTKVIEGYFLSEGRKFIAAHKDDLEAIKDNPHALNQYLKKNATPEQRAFYDAQKFHVELSDLAAIAVASVDNLFFAGGAYDSGDELRKIQPGDANVYSEQVRAFFMPGVKGEAKWLLKESGEEMRKKVETGDREEGVAREDFGGILGAWILDNAAANRTGFVLKDGSIDTKGFREGLRDNSISLIPDRLFYSLIDNERFSDDSISDYAGETLAQALISSNKTEIAPGIWDFNNGAEELPMLDLPYEMLGEYADVRSSAVKIYKHITASKPDDIMDSSSLINALTKVRKHPLTNGIFRDEDLMTACIINLESPPGLLRGTAKMLLNVQEYLYDSDVYNLTIDPRLFDGMATDFRTRLLKRLHANDETESMFTGKNLFRLFVPVLANSKFVSERAKIRQEAKTNQSKLQH